MSGLGLEIGIDRRKSSWSFASVSDSITLARDTRAVTFRDSGPFHISHA
jgi:hypothetical protein